MKKSSATSPLLSELPKQVMEFEDWFNLNEEEIDIELAESGADRELGFNSEREYEKRYEQYLKIESA